MPNNCPRCESDQIRRSKRRGLLERVPLTLIFVRPFRCRECRHRFFGCSLGRKREGLGAPKVAAWAGARD